MFESSITTNDPQGEIVIDNSKFTLNPDATLSLQIDINKTFIKTDYKTDLSINTVIDATAEDISSCLLK